jgi:ATP-dependent DNA ligase
MLACSGRLPTSGDYAYEVKWDGFRAIVSTRGPLRVRSRRGCDMTTHVRFLAHSACACCVRRASFVASAARP